MQDISLVENQVIRIKMAIAFRNLYKICIILDINLWDINYILLFKINGAQNKNSCHIILTHTTNYFFKYSRYFILMNCLLIWKLFKQFEKVTIMRELWNILIIIFSKEKKFLNNLCFYQNGKSLLKFLRISS